MPDMHMPISWRIATSRSNLNKHAQMLKYCSLQQQVVVANGTLQRLLPRRGGGDHAQRDGCDVAITARCLPAFGVQA